jgi:hypothetical protein
MYTIVIMLTIIHDRTRTSKVCKSHISTLVR